MIPVKGKYPGQMKATTPLWEFLVRIDSYGKNR